MKRTLKLGVNIDHVATLRQARLGKFPSPEYAAKVCEQAGADGITGRTAATYRMRIWRTWSARSNV